MTVAVEAPHAGPRLRRDFGILAAVLVVLLAVVGFVGFRVWDWWRYHGEISVDFDPRPLSDPPRGPLDAWPHSPDGSLAAVEHGDRTFVIDTSTGAPVADLGVVDATAFVTDEILVAFGEEVLGPHEGLAVIDLADGSVDQVEERGGTEGVLHPVSVRADGRCPRLPVVPVRQR